MLFTIFIIICVLSLLAWGSGHVPSSRERETKPEEWKLSPEDERALIGEVVDRWFDEHDRRVDAIEAADNVIPLRPR